MYKNLVNGDTLASALAATYRHLLHEAKAPDWHLLRAYAVDGGWGALVEPPGDVLPNREPPQTQFLDPEGYRVRVATPEQFVGRRRALQRCLRELRNPQRTGVLLHGLGGVGKSSLAARLLERLEPVGYKLLCKQSAGPSVIWRPKPASSGFLSEEGRWLYRHTGGGILKRGRAAGCRRPITAVGTG